jgi:GAF domain-containing protein
MVSRALRLWITLVEFCSVSFIGLIPALGWDLWIVVFPALGYVGVQVVWYLRENALELALIKAQLEMLVSLVQPAGGNVRCTYHVPVKKLWWPVRQLRQAFDYAPAGRGGKRRFPVEKGIIGRAFTEKAEKVENFANDDEYRDKMVKVYNYSVDELAKRSADRRSYLCIPILDETHTVLGLLYLDSDVPGTFSLDKKDLAYTLAHAAVEHLIAQVL